MSFLLTTAQALVKFLNQQYISFDGIESPFVEGIFTIFGHGNVAGLGQALSENPGHLKYYQGKNEQGMALAATAFARQKNRKKIIAASSSVGPGAANMVTAAACATSNNIPLLLFPGDTFATRQPDPVLQQVEQSYDLNITTNDSFKAVCKYWDRIARPEQLMTAMINAMRVLTDPAETGAVCISLPQDVQGESYEYPEYFFQKRVHYINRPKADHDELARAFNAILSANYPLVICGGGVKYSEAGEQLKQFCSDFNIPMAETQAGKSAVASSFKYNLGGIGVTGNAAANKIAQNTDCLIALGTRLSDFTTASKTLFKNPSLKIININISRFHAYKMDSITLHADAKAALEDLSIKLKEKKYKAAYTKEIADAKSNWEKEMDSLASYHYQKENFETLIGFKRPGSLEQIAKESGSLLTQTSAICKIREIIESDAIIVGAAGSLPGDLQRMWTTDCKDSYHLEYAYSCMGYEIAGSLGAKMAEPEHPVYAFLGDGSFYMMHSELLTAIQENLKITVLLFDNSSNGCINNLQMSLGITSFGTDFCHRNEDGKLLGKYFTTNFAKIAEGYGAVSYQARDINQLEKALNDAKKEPGPVLIDIKVLPKTMTNGYLSWWHVGVASVTKDEKTKKVYDEHAKILNSARRY